MRFCLCVCVCVSVCVCVCEREREREKKREKEGRMKSAAILICSVSLHRNPHSFWGFFCECDVIGWLLLLLLLPLVLDTGFGNWRLTHIGNAGAAVVTSRSIEGSVVAWRQEMALVSASLPPPPRRTRSTRPLRWQETWNELRWEMSRSSHPFPLLHSHQRLVLTKFGNVGWVAPMCIR